ncbi:MAG TPA: hypothetical protein VJA21_25600 [Verrucomicrobiae bacterium]
MPANAKRQARFSDYLELLKVLAELDAPPLIVGGQAVNFWAEAFEEEEPELHQYQPFTSADLDLYRPDRTARGILSVRAGHIESERDPFGKAFTIVSRTFVIRGGGASPLLVDELKMVSGLLLSEVKKSGVVVEFSGVRLHVLTPIACLKAKLYNLANLDQSHRQDERHVRILILCTRAFIRRLLGESLATGKLRLVLNSLEQLLSLTSRRQVVRTSRLHRIDLSAAVPLTELKGAGHPKVLSFLAKRLPLWLHSLERS